jgi:hypothetical protein
MCLFIVVLTSGCECAGRIVKQNACVFIVEHCGITDPCGDTGQMSPAVARTGSWPTPLLDRAVSDGVSRSKQLLFNK